MSYQYVYVMKSLTKRFQSGKEILKDIWLSFYPGAKIGIIGVNGSGKSTLLKIMAGLDKEFQGEAWAAESAKVGYLPQEPALDDSLNVIDNIKAGLTHITDLLKRFEEISVQFMEPMSDDAMNALISEQAELQEKIDHLDAWDLDRRIHMAMDALQCPAADAAVPNLSGGEKRRIALCRLLMQQPDLLLLDEPTNHLDAASVAWLERHLQEYKGSVVLITHDRYFLDNVVGWILELDRGNGYPFEGNYSQWLEMKQKRLSQEEKQKNAKSKQIEEELEWIRKSPKGRQSKSKARIQSYETLVAEASAMKERSDNAITIPTGPRLGENVIHVDHVSKSYEGRLVIDDASFKIPRGAIVGIIGPNGAGKSTLFRMITGEETPDQGRIHIGDSVAMGYVNQSRDALDPHKTIWEEISDGLDMILLGKREVSSRSYCGQFNFKGSDQQKKIGTLSGGERNRVHLARILKSNANVLLLDEPTNDLDIETLRSLEEGLLGFAGTALVISHDRFFLDRVATHILAYEGDSHIEYFEGNFQSYEDDFKRRFGYALNDIGKNKYKKLSK
jgi:ATP-binding cassette ChvD family protein